MAKCYKFLHLRNEQKFSALFSILAQASLQLYNYIYVYIVMDDKTFESL